MKNIKKSSFITLAILAFLCFGIATSCTEPFQMKTNTFEDALVIEATLTNELKKQQIKVSRAYRLEENTPVFENGAQVYITDNEGNQYNFTEQSNVYESETEFQAIAGKEYQLHVITSNGKEYISTKQTLSAVNEMQDVTAEVGNLEGERGVSIKVHSNDPTNSSKYYRYEYEETYKIIAPKWSGFKMIYVGPYEIGLIPRTTEARVCYKTDISTDIQQVNTTGLTSDQVDYQVRFISNQNYIITHRYSILVRQYIQKLEAYTYYKNLKEMSGSGSVLSPLQPGFLSGNLKSVSNPNEKVIGFFEVASVSSKRIFFNYADLFPGEAIPPYRNACPVDTLRYCFNPDNPKCAGWQLVQYAAIGNPIYYLNSGPDYLVVPAPCGDCTTFASNVIPPFWH